jgi:hypothetical protein
MTKADTGEPVATVGDERSPGWEKKVLRVDRIWSG